MHPVAPGAPAAVAPVGAAIPSVGSPGGNSYPRPPLGGRFLAYVLDAVIASALVPLGVLLLNAALIMGDPPVIGIVVLTVGGLWSLGYLLARDVAGGAGFGKRLMGLVVVSAQSGYPAAAGPTIVRQLVMFALGLIPAVGGLIEPILVLVDKDGRRLGDKAAKTQVARSADVAARGIAVRTGKGVAIAVVLVALVVSLVGSVVGGIAIARTAVGGTADWQPVVDDSLDQNLDSALDGPEDVTPETPAAEDPPLAPDEPASNPLTPETAVDAVGNLLNELKMDNVGRARTFTTRHFQEEYDWFLYPSGVALINFEVSNVYRDNALFVVETSEEWNSGPENVMYFVIVEDGQARVDELAYPDY